MLSAPPPLSSTTTEGRGSYPPLALSISKACGSRHTELNELIMNSLPLGLPPHATDTRLYAAGLASFTTIYTSFEEAWDEYLDSKSVSAASRGLLDQDQAEEDDSLIAHHKKQVYDFIAHIDVEHLRRTPRIQKDLDFLRTPGTPSSTSLKKRKEGKVQHKFRKHILKTISKNPHELYAYTWTMYMAIFAGGRYIRQELANYGNEFWENHGISGDASSQTPQSSLLQEEQSSDGPSSLDRLGFSFLSFAAKDDGEGIKNEFVKRLWEAENLFKEHEKEDIVDEAKHIFDLTIDLVKEMKDQIRPGTTSSSLSPSSHSNSQSPSPPSYTPHTTRSTERLPTYRDTLIDLEKNFTSDTTALLNEEADEEEAREWYTTGRAGPKRNLLFWIKFILLIIATSLVGWLLIVGTKVIVPQYQSGMGFGCWERVFGGSHRVLAASGNGGGGA